MSPHSLHTLQQVREDESNLPRSTSAVLRSEQHHPQPSHPLPLRLLGASFCSLDVRAAHRQASRSSARRGELPNCGSCCEFGSSSLSSLALAWLSQQVMSDGVPPFPRTPRQFPRTYDNSREPPAYSREPPPTCPKVGNFTKVGNFRETCSILSSRPKLGIIVPSFVDDYWELKRFLGIVYHS